MNQFNLAILASGEGSTGEVLFDKATVVIVSGMGTGIVERVKKYNSEHENRLKWELISRTGYRDRFEFGFALLRVLKRHKINFISQNGWTVFTPENVLNVYQGKIINSHPGPLDPGYLDFGGKGMNDLAVHKAVLLFKKHVNRPFKSEICLHKVTNEFDKGDLVAFKEVEVLDRDSPESLQARVKQAERELLIEFWSKVEKEGKIEPIQREKRVILPGEENILEQAKRVAIAEYAKE